MCGQACPRRWRPPARQVLLDYVQGWRPVHSTSILATPAEKRTQMYTRKRTHVATAVNDGGEAACTVGAEHTLLVSASSRALWTTAHYAERRNKRATQPCLLTASIQLINLRLPSSTEFYYARSNRLHRHNVCQHELLFDRQRTTTNKDTMFVPCVATPPKCTRLQRRGHKAPLLESPRLVTLFSYQVPRYTVHSEPKLLRTY